VADANAFAAFKTSFSIVTAAAAFVTQRGGRESDERRRYASTIATISHDLGSTWFLSSQCGQATGIAQNARAAARHR